MRVVLLIYGVAAGGGGGGLLPELLFIPTGIKRPLGVCVMPGGGACPPAAGGGGVPPPCGIVSIVGF